MHDGLQVGDEIILEGSPVTTAIVKDVLKLQRLYIVEVMSGALDGLVGVVPFDSVEMP